MSRRRENGSSETSLEFLIVDFLEKTVDHIK